MYPGPRKNDSKKDYHDFVWLMGCFSKRQSAKSEWTLGLEKKGRGRRVLQADWSRLIQDKTITIHLMDLSTSLDRTSQK